MTDTVPRRLLDVVPTVALLALGLVALFADGHGSGFRAPRGVDAAFVAATSLPLLARRRHPVLVLLATFAAQAAWITAYYNCPDQPPFEPFVAGVVACFALGFHADRRGLRRGVAVFGVAVLGSAASLAAGGASVGNSLPALVWWASAIGVGWGLHERQALVELLRDRSARLERDRERDVDDGPPRAKHVDGAGHGLIGMRERAALYGGGIEAAPLAGGGFRVRARLRIEPEPVA
jgi:hypothetical protein